MITAEQIPDEVVERLCEGLSYWDREATRAALATALNAWPGVRTGYVGFRMDKSERGIILPLPKEGSENPRKELDGTKYWDDPDTYGYS
jgi:hypothetical protein